MKLNLGCGHNRIPGYINVDAAPACQPDQLWDLEQFPWPWADDSVTEALFIHSLEHIGFDPRVFLRVMTELYRVMAPDGEVKIYAPHPRSDDFLNDPTHVRPITPQMLRLFDREENDRIKAIGGANTPLAHYTGVDFRLTHQQFVLAEPYATAMKDKTMTAADVTEAMASRWNVAREVRVTLKAVKTVEPGP
jgi:hypothetical protein